MSVPTPDTLATRLESTLLRDRPRLRRALRRLRRHPDPDAARAAVAGLSRSFATGD